MNATPKISVITPTWNRGDYLERVWSGLDSQTYRCFEWIVANDGSEDDTIEIVRRLAQKSDFPIKLINASTRVGKSCIDNAAVKETSGEFIIWCDSDDVLLKDVLATLMDVWGGIPAERRDSFVGVTALCDTEDGVLGKNIPPGPFTDLPLNDLLRSMRSDLVIFTRASALKQNPFLEVDFLIPESSVWNAIGHNLTRFVPRILQRKYYRQTHALSHSGKMEFSRGRAFALALTNKHCSRSFRRLENVRRAITFLRYCIHGDIAFRQAVELWSAGIKARILLIVLRPPAALLAMNDRRRGIVVKTHLTFAKAQEKSSLEMEFL